jgi:hypothetical protein
MVSPAGPPFEKNRPYAPSSGPDLCAIGTGGLNRSTVGKTAISARGQLRPLPQRLRLRSSLVPARYAMLSSGMATLGGGYSLVLHSAAGRHTARLAPLTHRFNLH